MKKREIHWSSSSSNSSPELERKVPEKEKRQIVMTSGSLPSKEERKRAKKQPKQIVVKGTVFKREVQHVKKTLAFGANPGDMFRAKKSMVIYSVYDTNKKNCYVPYSHSSVHDPNFFGTVFVYLYDMHNMPYFLSDNGSICAFGDSLRTLKIIERF